VESAARLVLVIDDDELNLKLVRTILVRQGYRVAVAPTAEEGLALARRESPDLVLMDIRLPGMDGLEATRQLKADPLTRHIPVVAVSAYAMAEDRLRAAEAGCAGYITKPLDHAAFVSDVKDRIAMREHAGEVRR